MMQMVDVRAPPVASPPERWAILVDTICGEGERARISPSSTFVIHFSSRVPRQGEGATLPVAVQDWRPISSSGFWAAAHVVAIAGLGSPQCLGQLSRTSDPRFWGKCKGCLSSLDRIGLRGKKQEGTSHRSHINLETCR